MKKVLPLLFLMPAIVFSQKDSTVVKKYAAGGNIVKINLSSLLLNNYNITYERRIANKVSFSIGYRYMPNGELPYQKQISNLLNFKDIDLSAFRLGGYAITPELRIYTHKNMRGFYIAPYGRYTSMDMSLPVTYTVTPPAPNPPQTKNAFFNGTVTAFSGGVMIGTQHNIFKNCVIDIWIIGAHFGNSNGDLTATFSPALSSTYPPPPNSERESLQKAIDNIDASPFKITGKVDASGSFAKLNSSGPWVGVRAIGINFGFRF